MVLSLSKGLSAFNLSVIQNNIEEIRWISAIGIILMILVFRGKKLSVSALGVFVIIQSVYCFYYFFISFDKYILALILCNLIIGFYNFINLKIEFEDAIYVPGYYKNLLEIDPYYSVNVLLKKNDAYFKGVLTNWDYSNCFILLEEDVDINGEVEVVIEFERRKYTHVGNIYTKYYNGYGIKIDQSYESVANHTWYDFFTILSHRGIKPV